MNLTDELQKLAELHRQGHLTDQEFTDAKQKLIYESKLDPSLSQEGEKLPASADPQIPEKYFRSSRL